MFKYLVVIAAVAYLAVATDFSNCKKGDPPLKVNIKDCEVQPCPVIKGTEAVMDMQFVAKRDNTTKLMAKVTAYMGMIAIPYPIEERLANVCNNLLHGAYCPLDKNEDVTYRFVFPLDDSYPEIQVKVQVALEDENKEIVSCFAVNVKVMRGNSGGSKVLALE
ncbi:hypothetical protein ACFFRR_002051 [Megaselia abdita]